MSINDKLQEFFNDLATDAVEERVIEYVIREVHNGRRLTEVIDDPYVRNRLNDKRRAELLEDAEVIDALEAEIRASFAAKDFGFSS